MVEVLRKILNKNGLLMTRKMMTMIQRKMKLAAVTAELALKLMLWMMQAVPAAYGHLKMKYFLNQGARARADGMPLLRHLLVQIGGVGTPGARVRKEGNKHELNNCCKLDIFWNIFWDLCCILCTLC
ncbi:hypothetical protein RHGRI_021875 [Rhododendron griersonianum]|uniref:Uncharacterized protein n=1 Tax=Rhododendron griersonianum TaxID=479676 RepID=A0AAV6JR71_9ERIC|nr:hypothetical protein RHGRI_021875 [Rhododendron griersonianum]